MPEENSPTRVTFECKNGTVAVLLSQIHPILGNVPRFPTIVFDASNHKEDEVVDMIKNEFASEQNSSSLFNQQRHYGINFDTGTMRITPFAGEDECREVVEAFVDESPVSKRTRVHLPRRAKDDSEGLHRNSCFEGIIFSCRVSGSSHLVEEQVNNLDRGKMLVCPVCPESYFYMPDNLKRHMLKHEEHLER